MLKFGELGELWILPCGCDVSQQFFPESDGIVTFLPFFNDLKNVKHAAFCTSIDFLQHLSLIRSQYLTVSNVFHSQASGIVEGSLQFIIFDVVSDGFQFVFGQTVQIGVGFRPTIDLNEN